MKNQILLYGASNLWLSRRAALTEVRRRFPGHLEIGLAHGPGRSYGLRAGNPLFHYEPLSAVDFGFYYESSVRRVAFITDIGNDIAYSQAPEQVVGWVTDLALRLEAANFEIVIGGLPAKSLATLNPTFFRSLARLYYSNGTAVTRDQVTRDLEEIEVRIEQLCRDRGYRFQPADSAWYSPDRFHLKPSTVAPYWSTLMQSFGAHNDYESRWSYRVRQPLFPQKYWFVGKERNGRSRYRNLVPNSVVLVR